MENKEMYSLSELFEFLPVEIRELGQMADINEVTVARIRDGKPARRATVNKLLNALSKVYQRPLSLRNVTGMNVQVNKRHDAQAARAVKQQQAA